MRRILRKLRTKLRRLSVSPDALETAGSRSRDGGGSMIGPVNFYDEGRPRK